MKRTLVLGLGNPILSDDSVGLRVVQELQKMCRSHENLVIDEDYWGGLRLMERLAGFDRAIIIDAIQSGAPPGTIHCLRPDELPTQHSASAHDVNLPTALALGRQMGWHLPPDDQIILLAIEAEDVLTFGEECTPQVAAAVPEAVKRVQEILAVWEREEAGQG